MNKDKIAFNALGTQAKVLFESLLKVQAEIHPKKDCELCHGTGTTYISDGFDDVDGEPCYCLTK